MSHRDYSIRVYIAEGKLTLTGLNFSCEKEALRAVETYPAVQVEVKGKGVMQPEEFVAYYKDKARSELG